MTTILRTGVLILSTLAILTSCGKNPETSSADGMASAREDAYYGYYHRPAAWWGWSGWGGGRAVTAWGDHLRFIGQARYYTALANYQNAAAAREWVRARAYARLMHSMELDLRRLEREKYQMDVARKTLHGRARSLNGLVQGKLSYARPSLVLFTGLPGFSSLPIVTETKKVGPFGPEHFIVNPERTRYIDGKMVKEKVEVETFNGGTVEEFLAWIAVKQYDVKVETAAEGSPLTPWQILMAVRSQVQEQIALTDKALAEEQKKSTAELITLWGESIWGNYGAGLLKSYEAQIQAAKKLK